MTQRSFLIRSGSEPRHSSLSALAAPVAADAAANGCAVRNEYDLSQIMNELCLGIEVEGPLHKLEQVAAAWSARGLRVDRADQEIHELNHDQGNTDS